MKKAYIRQDVLSYNDYIKMNSNSSKVLVLPTLLDITNFHINQQEVEQYYVHSYLSFKINRELLELMTDKIIEQQNQGKIKLANYIDSDEKVSRVTSVVPGNLDINPGGFYLAKGRFWLKKEEYHSLDDINNQVIKQLKNK